MAKRKNFIEIEGYDESLVIWGGDDDNVRIRLEMNGVKRLFLPEVKLLHREKRETLNKRKNKQSYIPINILKKVLLPYRVQPNMGHWGSDFSDIVYSWDNKTDNKLSLQNFLLKFKNYDLLTENTDKMFNKILLVQSYNEEEFIKQFLKNNTQYFDAIILLDDDSNDNTYEIASHPKIILKVRKKRIFFNDLENRNILLDLVSFFNCIGFVS